MVEGILSRYTLQDLQVVSAGEKVVKMVEEKKALSLLVVVSVLSSVDE